MRARASTITLLLLLGACGDPPDGPGDQGPPGAHGRAAHAPLDLKALRAALERAGIEARGLHVWRSTPELSLHALPVEADGAIALWTRAREHVDDWGHYPVVVDDTFGEFRAQLSKEAPRPGPTLVRAAGVDPVAWSRARVETDPEYYGEVELGTWSPGEPQQGYSVPYDHEDRPRPGLQLVFVPTTRPWEAIAWFEFGGWNECPEPEVHVAVHRRWHERYGAELVCLSKDVLEMRVPRPALGRDEALKLAHEHFVYSGGDLVYQGFDSLRALATSLVGARTWYFWWD